MSSQQTVPLRRLITSLSLNALALCLEFTATQTHSPSASSQKGSGLDMEPESERWTTPIFHDINHTNIYIWSASQSSGIWQKSGKRASSVEKLLLIFALFIANTCQILGHFLTLFSISLAVLPLSCLLSSFKLRTNTWGMKTGEFQLTVKSQRLWKCFYAPVRWCFRWIDTNISQNWNWSTFFSFMTWRLNGSVPFCIKGAPLITKHHWEETQKSHRCALAFKCCFDFTQNSNAM